MIHVSRSSLLRIAAPALLLACATLRLGAAQSAVRRTPDGHPDLSGMWTNYDTTPFERLGPGEEFPRDLAVSTADWLVQDSPISPRRPSMVVDPPNGRVPLKREAIEKRDAALALDSGSLEHYGPWERCITRGVPGSMWPGAYNNGHQIVQTSDFVVLHSEMIHEARVIPLHGRPHLPAGVRSWDGDSRGHWEGDTLVVETSDLQESVDQTAAHSEVAHIVERFHLTPDARGARCWRMI